MTTIVNTQGNDHTWMFHPDCHRERSDLFKTNYERMKTVSLKLDDSVYLETEDVLNRIQKPRNRYINEALAFYNKIQKKKLLASRLEKESHIVQEESMNVLREFEMLEE